MIQQILKIGGALALCTLSACKEESSSLFESQVCLDKIDVSLTASLDSSVDSCLSKISGKSSDQAYTLRCAGDFIKQGIAELALVEAIQDLDKSDQAKDPTITALDALEFDTIANASEAVSNCSQSGSTALTALAGLSSMATIIKTAANTNLDDFIENYNPTDMSSDEKVALANTIISSQESLCEKDSGLMEGNDVCENIDAAVALGGATDAEKEALVDEFMNNMKE